VQASRQYPVVTVTGPRQSGKTTLCRATFPESAYINLEAPDTRAFAQEDPRGFLATIPNGAFLDEIQRVPELPSYIQGIVDSASFQGKFILTGSQQFELMNQVSQSLAGRTALLRLLPLSINELKNAGMLPSLFSIMHSGFYPRIFQDKLDPTQMLSGYFSTYVERDLRQISVIHDLQKFERFARLCAGRTGQLLNMNNLANDAGIAHSTARQWLDLLQASYIIFLLPPWFTNTRKRLVKSPKLYFYDVGLASWLLGIHQPEQIQRDPLFGALFENMVVLDRLKSKYNAALPVECYFYRDNIGNEVDLIEPRGAKVHAIEIKAGATINSDYFKALGRFRKAFPEKFLDGTVIYGGQQSQKRSDWTIWPWDHASFH
jgi:predicted AAA+ superfamily ATPase